MSKKSTGEDIFSREEISSSESSQLLNNNNVNQEDHYSTFGPPDSLEVPKAYKLKFILPALWMGSFLAAMDGTVVANIMGNIAADFEQEDMKSWIATSYLLTNTAFQPLYGKVSDIIGRKNALMIAQFFFGLGCFLSIFAQNVTQFSIARAVCGIGGGGLGAMSSIVVSDIVTLEERGLYQGYANLNFAAGQSLGAPLGGLLLTTIGWRWIFGIQVPGVLVCMWMNYKFVNVGHDKPLTRENLARIDFGGSVTLVLTITAFLLFLSTNLNKFVLSILFLISGSGFLYIETYVAKEQIVPSDLVKGLLGIYGLLSLASSFVSNATIFGIPSFLQIVQNQTNSQSGGYLMFIVISLSFGSLISGYLLRRLKYDVKRSSLFISFISTFIMFIGILFIFEVIYIPNPYDTDIGWKVVISLGLVLLGLGYGSVLVSILIALVAFVGKEGQAAATGMNYLFRSIGQVLGVGISLAVYNNTIKKSLTELLSNVENGDEILRNLLRDSEYLKHSKLISKELLYEILEAYKHAVASSFYLIVLLGLAGLVVSGIITIKYGLGRH